MTDIYLSLGSNLGDREANLEAALSLLDRRLGPRVRVSSIMETPAFGFDGPDFLNLAALYRSDIGAMELLWVCKETERELGRTGAPKFGSDGSRIYESRTIDIDILLYGKREIDLPELKVPHPGLQDRPFMRIPLKEIFEND